MNALGIIPARYQSTRLPAKPLLDIFGKSMIMRVYEQAKKCHRLDSVVIATDDDRVFKHVESHGGRVVLTSSLHNSGTDRCAEVAMKKEFEEFEFIVNIQGDEPFINPSQIEQVVDLLQKNEGYQIATLAKEIEDKETFHDPNKVKVVTTNNGKALYFSRSPIPFLRDSANGADQFPGSMKHIGLYGFRREILLQLSQLPPGELEMKEQLEQLRWLENGFEIGVGVTEFESIGVDTQADLERIQADFRKYKNEIP